MVKCQRNMEKVEIMAGAKTAKLSSDKRRGKGAAQVRKLQAEMM